MQISNIKFEYKPCPMGCKENDLKLLSARDILYNMPGTFTVVKCSQCGLLRTNPRPSIDSIHQYYPKHYGPFLSNLSFQNVNSKRERWIHFFRKIFQFKSNCVPEIPIGRMLEIGCASGQFLRKMAGYGWDVEGIEVSKIVGERAEAMGYKIHIGLLEEAPEPLVPYDLIVGWMVLEHLHEPILCLEKMKKCIKPNGWLVLSVPNVDTVEFKLFKNYWYALQLPTHLHHFTPQTVTKLLYKSGWEVKKVFHQRILLNLLHSLSLKLKDNNSNSLIAKMINSFIELGLIGNIILYPIALILSVFKQTGRMTIWAQIKK